MEELRRHLRELMEWESTVGKAIVSFGELELITYQCLVHFPSDKISDTSSKLSFSRRVDLITEILEFRASSSEVVRAFIEMLRRSRKLAEIRNHIAHNPVMINLFLDKAGQPLTKRGISSFRGERFIELEELKEFAGAVEDLASEMWAQMGKLSEEEEAH